MSRIGKSFVRPHLLAIPPVVGCGLEPVTGSMTGTQIYDASGAETWSPSWAIIPLQLRLRVDFADPAAKVDPATMVDPDAPSQAELLGCVAGSWRVVDGAGVETPVDFASGGMFAAVTGKPTEIKVVSNLNPEERKVLVFDGTFSRNGFTTDLRAVYPLRCLSASQPTPRLDVDIPKAWVYDPVSDRRAVHKMAATLTQGSTVFTPDVDCVFYWELWKNGGWIKLDPNETSGAEFNLGANSNKLELQLDLLCDGTRVRCSAAWAAGDGVWAGSPQAAALIGKTVKATAPTPTYEFVIFRRSGELDCNILGVPDEVEDPSVIVKGSVEVFNAGQPVADPLEVCDITWYAWSADQNTHGQVNPASAKVISTGTTVSFPASMLTEEWGAGLSVKAVIKGPKSILKENETSNAVLTEPGTGIWLKA